MYIDPGMGALLLQGLIGGVLAVTYLFKSKIKSLIHSLTKQKDKNEKEDE